MSSGLEGLGIRPQELRQAGARRLKELDQSGPRPEPGCIDILWGWDQIADALNIGVNKAKRLFELEGLPVWAGRGDAVQSTRAALQAWANCRALEPSEMRQKMLPFISKIEAC